MTRMINTFGEHGPSFGSDVERFRFASQTSSLCPVYLFTYLFVSDCRWRRLCVDLLKRHWQMDLLIDWFIDYWLLIIDWSIDLQYSEEFWANKWYRGWRCWCEQCFCPYFTISHLNIWLYSLVINPQQFWSAAMHLWHFVRYTNWLKLCAYNRPSRQWYVLNYTVVLL